MEILLAVAGAVGALSIIAGAAVKWVVKPMWGTWKRVKIFLEDWHGEEPRPGVSGRPGVMPRLAALESEFHPNTGTSARDALDRIEKQLAEHIKDPAAHRPRQE